MVNLAWSIVMLIISANFASSQTQSVSVCPLYLVLQNRCPTPSTTLGTTTTRTTTALNGNGTDASNESDVDSCGLPTITFCPATQQFLTGDRSCTDGQSIQVNWTTLGQLLVSPSVDRAARMVGSSSVEALGNTFSSISKTIQGTPTQATIGVTFIPVGQLIGG